MNKALLKYIPKTKLAAIKDIYRDSDGYWIILHEGREASRIDRDCHVISQDTIAELKYQIGGIRKVRTGK